MAKLVGWRFVAASAATGALVMTGAAKCGGGSVQVPGGPEVKVHQQQRPEMRRQCPVCSGKGRVFGTRCRWCKGFGRVRL